MMEWGVGESFGSGSILGGVPFILAGMGVPPALFSNLSL